MIDITKVSKKRTKWDFSKAWSLFILENSGHQRTDMWGRIGRTVECYKYLTWDRVDHGIVHVKQKAFRTLLLLHSAVSGLRHRLSIKGSTSFFFAARMHSARLFPTFSDIPSSSVFLCLPLFILPLMWPDKMASSSLIGGVRDSFHSSEVPHFYAL